MTRGAWFGLGAIVFMFAEPWLRRWLDHRPPIRPERPVPPAEVRPPVRGQLLRPGRELDRGDRWGGGS